MKTLSILLLAIVIIIMEMLFITSRFLKKYLFRGATDLGIDYGEEFLKLRGKAQQWQAENPEEMVYTKSKDGLNLAAHYWDRGKELTAIFIHGYGNTGQQVTLVANQLMEVLDANILAPDCRGSGKSGGDWIGLGWPDRLDVQTWAEYIARKEGPEHRIILMGISMGGATVLSAAGEKLPANVRAICSDCAYNSVSELLKHLLKRYTHIPAAPVLWCADILFRMWFGYSLYEANPLEQVKKATVPILFIHGEVDHFVPTYMSEMLYDACPTPKELLLVPNAAHAMSLLTQRERYFQTIHDFCKMYCRK